MTPKPEVFSLGDCAAAIRAGDDPAAVLKLYGESEHQRGAARVRALEEALREAREHLACLWKIQVLSAEKNDAAATLAVLRIIDAAIEAPAEGPSSEYQRGRGDGLRQAAEVADAVHAEAAAMWNENGGVTGTPDWITSIPAAEWQRQCWRYAGSGGADCSDEIAQRIRALMANAK